MTEQLDVQQMAQRLLAGGASALVFIAGGLLAARLGAQVPGRSGLLLGLVVSDAWKGRAKDIQKAAEAQGLMVLIAGMDVVRLAPALIVSDEQIAEAGRLLRAAIDGMLKA